MPQCGGLGIYRRRTFTIEARHCRHGHAMLDHNLVIRGGTSFCHACYLMRKQRWYWSNQLERYWKGWSGPKVPVTDQTSQPIFSTGAGSGRTKVDDPDLATRG